MDSFSQSMLAEEEATIDLSPWFCSPSLLASFPWRLWSFYLKPGEPYGMQWPLLGTSWNSEELPSVAIHGLMARTISDSKSSSGQHPSSRFYRQHFFNQGSTILVGIKNMEFHYQVQHAYLATMPTMLAPPLAGFGKLSQFVICWYWWPHIMLLSWAKGCRNWFNSKQRLASIKFSRRNSHWTSRVWLLLATNVSNVVFGNYELWIMNYPRVHPAQASLLNPVPQFSTVQF